MELEKRFKFYCDVDNSEFQTPSIITGNKNRSDIVILKGNLCLILELTVGFETNLRRNSERKFKNYKDLIIRLNDTYNFKFVNLSMGAIRVIGMDVNIWSGVGSNPVGSVGQDLNLQKLNYQCLTTSVTVVLVVR